MQRVLERYKFICLSFALVYGLSNKILAQPYTFKWDYSPTVQIQNQILNNAWAGGLNSAQFSKMHLNNDDIEDLVVFDRATNQVLTFLAIKQSSTVNWQHTPKYEALFPTDLVDWMLLIDYDRDGRKDLFTATNGGIRVFKNTPAPDGSFVWKLVANALVTQGFSGKFNLYVPSTDLPAITDIDNDGDIDILAFDFTGNTLELHQNFSVEQKSTEPFIFKKITSNWGLFFKEHCNDFRFNQEPIVLSYDTPPSNARIMHAGNAVWVGDLNNDGFKDLLHGHVSCTNIAKLNNSNGNLLDARMISFDKTFPVNKPIDFQIFPAPFVEDFDGDGKRDLIATPNSLDYSKNPLINLRQSAWFYQNEGTNEQPHFILKQDNFLQNTMIELGESSAPALADFDGDGDLDLWIGHNGMQTNTGFKGSVWFFKNIGTQQEAKFQLISTNFLGLSEQIFTQEQLLITNVKPFFNDVNGDGTIDFGIAANTFKGMIVRYVANTSARSKPMSFDSTKVNSISTPPAFANGENILYYDIDQDGKQDALVGKNSGNVEYHRNISNTTTPQYQLVTESFGGLDVDFEKRAQSLFVIDLNADRIPELLAADLMGKVRILKNFDKNSDTFTIDSILVFNEFSRKNQFQKIGMELVVTAGDLDGDELPDLLLGMNSGGVRLLRNTSAKANIPINPSDVIVYPNPTAHFLYIQTPVAGEVEVFNLIGQKVYEKPVEIGGIETEMDLQHLATGVYIVRFVSSNSQVSRKVIVAR